MGWGLELPKELSVPGFSRASGKGYGSSDVGLLQAMVVGH